MKELYIETKEISYHFYVSEYIYENEETEEKSALYNNGKGDYFVLIDPFILDESGTMRMVYQVLYEDDYREYLESVAKEGFIDGRSIDMLVASYVSAYKCFHNPDEIGPDSNLKVRDYEERALVHIRQKYADVDINCFSGRYTISLWNDKEEFTDLEGGYEYPGIRYSSPMRITGEQFVLKLVEDGTKNYENINKPLNEIEI